MRIRYTFEDTRPPLEVDWRDEWIYLPDSDTLPSVPFVPMRYGLKWLVPVITQIKIQTNLDFQSYLFGPELLTSTGGGRYTQSVYIVPKHANTATQADLKDAIWHWKDEVDWMPMAVVETEGDPVITPPMKEFIEQMELPIYRPCFFMIKYHQQHEVPAVLEGYPAPVGDLYITVDMHWEVYDNFDFGAMRAREILPRAGI